MDHEVMMSRQCSLLIVILACGLVPDRLSGRWSVAARVGLPSNLFNRVDPERIGCG